MDLDLQKASTVIHGVLRVKSQAEMYTETQPDIGCQIQALSHTQSHTHSQTVSSAVSPTDVTLRPLCSSGSPKVLPLLHPQSHTPSCFLRTAGQRVGRGARLGDWHRDQQPNGAAGREASEKELPRQQAPAEPTRGLDSLLLFLEVGPGLFELASGPGSPGSA